MGQVLDLPVHEPGAGAHERLARQPCGVDREHPVQHAVDEIDRPAARALDLLVRTKDKYPLSKVVSHSFPLADVNTAFAFAEWQGKNTGTAATRVILKP